MFLTLQELGELVSWTYVTKKDLSFPHNDYSSMTSNYFRIETFNSQEAVEAVLEKRYPKKAWRKLFTIVPMIAPQIIKGFIARENND